MALKITVRGIAGKDLNTSWGSNIGYTRNIYRWGAGEADDGNDEVGLGPFAYVHWGNGVGTGTNLNRYFNISSVSKTNTGRYNINYRSSWDEEYSTSVPYVNAQRYNSGTSTTSITKPYVTSRSTSSFTVHMLDTGLAYRDPTYAWALVLGPGRFSPSGPEKFVIDGSKARKADSISGNNVVNPSAYATVTSTGSGNYVITGYYNTSSMSNFGTGVYTLGFTVPSIDGSSSYPMIFTLGYRATQTTPAIVSMPSNSSYSTTSVTFRNHNTINSAIDFEAHIVMY